MLELAKWRKTGDLGPLSPKLRTDVSLHCMSLALRMQRRILYKFRGLRFVCLFFYRKSWRKYQAMYSFYDGYIDEDLKRTIEVIDAGVVDLPNEMRQHRIKN